MRIFRSTKKQTAKIKFIRSKASVPFEHHKTPPENSVLMLCFWIICLKSDNFNSLTKAECATECSTHPVAPMWAAFDLRRRSLEIYSKHCVHNQMICFYAPTLANPSRQFQHPHTSERIIAIPMPQSVELSRYLRQCFECNVLTQCLCSTVCHEPLQCDEIAVVTEFAEEIHLPIRSTLEVDEWWIELGHLLQSTYSWCISFAFPPKRSLKLKRFRLRRRSYSMRKSFRQHTIFALIRFFLMSSTLNCCELSLLSSMMTSKHTPSIL